MGAAVVNPDAVTPSTETTARIVKPGDMLFARLVTRAVSTKPGPVLAEIVGGVLNGSRLIGTFSQNDDVMFLEFSTLVYPNGDTTNIDAAAVDPADGTTGLATSVDRFFFERFVVAGAAAFLDEFADQFSDTESSVIISIGGGGSTTQETSEEASLEESVVAGIGDAAEVVTDEIERGRGRYSRPEVTIAQGTLFGLLFLNELIGPSPGSAAYKK
jgi:intracellular multiplication protein IcmE